MKMKKITLLTGAILLGSMVALTSCGEEEEKKVEVTLKDAENVDFAAYSTEITLDKYQEAHTKYTNSINLSAKDGYDFTSYKYLFTKIESDTEYSTATSTKESSKYNKADSVAVNSYSYYTFDDQEIAKDANVSYTTTIQKNDKGIDIVNDTTKTYSSSETSIEYYLMDTCNVANYVDLLTGTVDSTDNTKQIKYYGDNNVYTLKINITLNDERTEGSIQLKETTSTETVFQFYVSNTEVYGKSTTNKVVELEYTDGEKTGKVMKTEKNVKYATLKIGAQSITKADLSKYIKE